MQGRYVSYLRVSTDKQGKSGLGLEAQRAAVAQYLNGGAWDLLAEYREVETGKDNTRPQLARAIERCRLTGATPIVAKLDRLSRDAGFLFTLRDSGIDIRACDMPEANTMVFGIMALVAQHEREMISKRTREALAAAKARGVRMGGYRGVDPDHQLASAARRKAADGFAAGVAPMLREMQEQGCSLREMAARLASEGIRTARGGAWSADAVRRVLLRSF